MIDLLKDYGAIQSVIARPCKRLQGYQVELKIKGLSREDVFYPYRLGLDGLQAILKRYL